MLRQLTSLFFVHIPKYAFNASAFSLDVHALDPSAFVKMGIVNNKWNTPIRLIIIRIKKNMGTGFGYTKTKRESKHPVAVCLATKLRLVLLAMYL